MPARTGKSLQHRPRSRLFIEMHRLRIELSGKGQNFLARDAARSELAEMARLEVFEDKGVHDWGHNGEKPDCGRTLRQAQPAHAHGSSPACSSRHSELALC